MTTAIEFHNVSKFFRMDRERPRDFQQAFLALLNRGRNARKPKEDKEFWALRDVTFNIERGDSVGLVGSNGAGKSTALKLISRIIQPSSGNVAVHGRVTALLELGAGFHPELSGRDNVFLNGAVMGLSRRQISDRLDAIIDFAEIDDFIDVPVKDYSSGMFARLGFSVAVHLDPDILLVDEVLSVGDAAFQQKCNERMAALRKSGITILFVSHSADAVLRACTTALWLDHGHVRAWGGAQNVIDEYHEFVSEQTAARNADAYSERGGNGLARLTKLEVLDEQLQPARTVQTNRPVTLRFHYHAPQRIEDPIFGLAIYHVQTNAHLAGPNNHMTPSAIPFIEGDGYVDYHLDRLPFLAGEYSLTAVIYDGTGTVPYDVWINAQRMRVEPGDALEKHGLLAMDGRWTHFPSTARAFPPASAFAPQPTETATAPETR